MRPFIYSLFRERPRGQFRNRIDAVLKGITIRIKREDLFSFCIVFPGEVIDRWEACLL